MKLTSCWPLLAVILWFVAIVSAQIEAPSTTVTPSIHVINMIVAPHRCSDGFEIANGHCRERL